MGAGCFPVHSHVLKAGGMHEAAVTITLGHILSSNDALTQPQMTH